MTDLAARALANRDRARAHELSERERIRRENPDWIAFLADYRAVFGEVKLLRVTEWGGGYQWEARG